MIEPSLQHWNQHGNTQPIAGTWDLSKYGLRPTQTVRIDNYKRSLNAPIPFDTVHQTTTKPEGSISFKGNQSPTPENLGIHLSPNPILPPPPQGRFGGMYFTSDSWIYGNEVGIVNPNFGGSTVQRLFRGT